MWRRVNPPMNSEPYQEENQSSDISDPNFWNLKQTAGAEVFPR